MDSSVGVTTPSVPHGFRTPMPKETQKVHKSPCTRSNRPSMAFKENERKYDGSSSSNTNSGSKFESNAFKLDSSSQGSSDLEQCNSRRLSSATRSPTLNNGRLEELNERNAADMIDSISDAVPTSTPPRSATPENADTTVSKTALGAAMQSLVALMQTPSATPNPGALQKPNPESAHSSVPGPTLHNSIAGGAMQMHANGNGVVLGKMMQAQAVQNGQQYQVIPQWGYDRWNAMTVFPDPSWEYVQDCSEWNYAGFDASGYPIQQHTSLAIAHPAQQMQQVQQHEVQQIQQSRIAQQQPTIVQQQPTGVVQVQQHPGIAQQHFGMVQQHPGLIQAAGMMQQYQMYVPFNLQAHQGLVQAEQMVQSAVTQQAVSQHAQQQVPPLHIYKNGSADKIAGALKNLIWDGDGLAKLPSAKLNVNTSMTTAMNNHSMNNHSMTDPYSATQGNGGGNSSNGGSDYSTMSNYASNTSNYLSAVSYANSSYGSRGNSKGNGITTGTTGNYVTVKPAGMNNSSSNGTTRIGANRQGNRKGHANRLATNLAGNQQVSQCSPQGGQGVGNQAVKTTSFVNAPLHSYSTTMESNFQMMGHQKMQHVNARNLNLRKNFIGNNPKSLAAVNQTLASQNLKRKASASSSIVGPRKRVPDTSGKYLCTYLLGLKLNDPFDVAKRIIGPDGHNVKYISNRVQGCKVRLRGEGFQNENDTAPCQLNVSVPTKEGYLIAKHMVKELLEKIFLDYYHWSNCKYRPRVNCQEHPLNAPIDAEWETAFKKNNLWLTEKPKFVTDMKHAKELLTADKKPEEALTEIKTTVVKIPSKILSNDASTPDLGVDVETSKDAQIVVVEASKDGTPTVVVETSSNDLKDSAVVDSVKVVIPSKSKDSSKEEPHSPLKEGKVTGPSKKGKASNVKQVDEALASGEPSTTTMDLITTTTILESDKMPKVLEADNASADSVLQVDNSPADSADSDNVDIPTITSDLTFQAPALPDEPTANHVCTTPDLTIPSIREMKTEETTSTTKLVTQ